MSFRQGDRHRNIDPSSGSCNIYWSKRWGYTPQSPDAHLNLDGRLVQPSPDTVHLRPSNGSKSGLTRSFICAFLFHFETPTDYGCSLFAQPIEVLDPSCDKVPVCHKTERTRYFPDHIINELHAQKKLAVLSRSHIKNIYSIGIYPFCPLGWVMRSHGDVLSQSRRWLEETWRRTWVEFT
jgi:hypothetical protein